MSKRGLWLAAYQTELRRFGKIIFFRTVRNALAGRAGKGIFNEPYPAWKRAI